ncbi:MAG: hypothetical protein ACJ79W_15285 [Myxococcales bacterium]
MLPRGELEWICEFNGVAPVYLLPTPPFLRALATRVRACGARTVLEIAAGDGDLARSLARVAPDLSVRETDSGAWERPREKLHTRTTLYTAAA